MRWVWAIIVFSMPSLAQAPPVDMVFPRYVGHNVCTECHVSGTVERLCTVDTLAEHLGAFTALVKPEAAPIAKLSGVFERPTESQLCLGCHATGSDAGARWMADSFTVEDGVQCESCHGAGEFHVDQQRGHPVPSQPYQPAWISPGDRQTCTPCHIERHSHREVLERGYRISEQDAKYKTPVGLAISRDGRRLYVVCEHSHSLIVLDLVAGEVVYEVPVGRRPQAVAVSPDGRRVYVTNRYGDSLTVIDAEDGRVVATKPVGHEPHGVVTDARGERVYVLNTGDNTISVLDACGLSEVTRLSAGQGPWDLALSPDGESIYVTSVRPDPVQFRDPPRSEITVIDTRRGVVRDRWTATQANMLLGVDFVPATGVALFTLNRTKNLVPLTRLAQGWTITNGVGVVWPDGRIDQVLLDQPADYFADPSDAAVSPDGRTALVVGAGSNEVAVVDVASLLSTITEASPDDRIEVLPNHLGASSRFVVKRIGVGVNPRTVVFAPDGRFAYVANALDDSVTVIDASDYSVDRVISLGGPQALTEIRRGERLFYSAEVTYARQFSCHSCHPDGHINGLTFDIEPDGAGMRPVDNRTLRGIADTAPFKWEGTNPSLRRQCGARLAVFFTRLAPYTPAELDALERYMTTIERPPNPFRQREGLTVAQRHGQAVFDRSLNNRGDLLRADQRCVSCHPGAYKTNREKMPVGTTVWFDTPAGANLEYLFDSESYSDLGNFYFTDAGIPHEPFDVPHLNNIHKSPPYLHSGGAQTLEEIWTRFNIIDRHGETSDLTRRQLNDLIAYLKAL